MRLMLLVIMLLGMISQVQAGQISKIKSPLSCPKIVPEIHQSIDCWRESFLTAIAQSDYVKVNKWLEQDSIKKIVGEYFASDFLGMMFCKAGIDSAAQDPTQSETDFQGGSPIKPHDRELFLKITEQLLSLGASFEGMPSQQIVTTLFCAVNNHDSEMLDYMLTRTNVDAKNGLDACLYEGSDPSYVPIFRAIQNNDLESARVLLQHGASLNYREMETTPLIYALKLGKLWMADWLIDMGASVYETDTGVCSGKLPLIYAGELPADVIGRDTVMVKLESFMQVIPNPCKKR